MEVSHVDMDHIADQSNKTSVSAIQGFDNSSKNGGTPGSSDKQRDVYEMDSTRQYLRELDETGQIQNHVAEIIESEIKPDCLRAELAFRAEQGDNLAVSILLSYLAGNIKEALKKTNQLDMTGNPADKEKFAEFMCISNYFAGNFEKGCETAKNLPALGFSPLLCYVYADMLLSLGYVEDARVYAKKYVIFARRYLRNFVSEKEKYEDDKKRHEQSSRRGMKRKGEAVKKSKAVQTNQNITEQQDNSNQAEQSPELYNKLKVMLTRRRQLLAALKARNVSIDKRPLLFELEDIDEQIAQINGKKAVLD
jgi:hypothetical protein